MGQKETEITSAGKNLTARTPRRSAHWHRWPASPSIAGIEW